MQRWKTSHLRSFWRWLVGQFPDRQKIPTSLKRLGLFPWQPGLPWGSCGGLQHNALIERAAGYLAPGLPLGAGSDVGGSGKIPAHHPHHHRYNMWQGPRGHSKTLSGSSVPSHGKSWIHACFQLNPANPLPMAPRSPGKPSAPLYASTTNEPALKSSYHVANAAGMADNQLVFFWDNGCILSFTGGGGGGD